MFRASGAGGNDSVLLLPLGFGGGGGAFTLGPVLLPLFLLLFGGGGGRILGIVGLTFLLDVGRGGGIFRLDRSVNSVL